MNIYIYIYLWYIMIHLLHCPPSTPKLSPKLSPKYRQIIAKPKPNQSQTKAKPKPHSSQSKPFPRTQRWKKKKKKKKILNPRQLQPFFSLLYRLWMSRMARKRHKRKKRKRKNTRRRQRMQMIRRRRVELGIGHWASRSENWELRNEEEDDCWWQSRNQSIWNKKV